MNKTLSSPPRKSTAFRSTLIGGILLTSLMTITGCGMTSGINSVDVHVNFMDASSLKTGDAVMFNDMKIGVVGSIAPGDNGSQVVLNLDADKAGIVKSTAAASISAGTPKSVRILNPTGEQASVADGGTLKGLASPVDEAAWQAGKAFGSVREALQQAADSFNNYLGSDEWKSTQGEIERNLNDIGQQSKQAADELRGGVEKMMKDLESQSERTLKDAEKHYGDLEGKLREFGKDGQGELLDSVNRLLETLKSAMEGAQNSSGRPGSGSSPTTRT